jgi:hypothetical protein
MEAASGRNSDELILSVVAVTEFPCMEQEKLLKYQNGHSGLIFEVCTSYI